MVLAFGIGVPTALTIIFTPIFAWFDFSCTHLETNHWTTRYMFMLLYLIGNAAISIFPHTWNFLFFLTDGVILSQLTSFYLYNEFSMSALLTILPVLFVVHNHLLVAGIQKFVRDEIQQKLTFIRLIGRHDAVFLFVIYSLFTVIFTVVDIFS